MTEAAVLDNDVVIKICSYGLAHEVVEALEPFGAAATLGVTRLIVGRQVQRSRRIADKAAATEQLIWLMSMLAAVEPTDQEILLAADLESRALELSLPLDSGESQILAVLLTRTSTLMVTGDKRAISALERVLDAVGCSGRCNHRVACLEQLIMAILARCTAGHLQGCICKEPAADGALSQVFSCTSRSMVDMAAARGGLESHIRHVRSTAPSVLFPQDELSIVSQEDSVGGP